MTGRSSTWQATNKKPSKKQRSLLYELFVLGELFTGPHHGYLLREILNKILGPYKQISWGTLYPLIRRLESAELITVEKELVSDEPKKGGRGKQRNLFRITEAGQNYFTALINDAIRFESYNTEYFIMKLNYFDVITIEEQKAILQYHQMYLQNQLDFLEKQHADVSINEHISEAERNRIKWVIGFRQSCIDAEAKWVEEMLADSHQ